MNDRSPKTPLRARLKALTGTAILEAAERVFAEQGLQAGMDTIAAEAGVSVGTLYNHFTDREGLVRALFDQRVGQMLEALDRADAESLGQPFRERLTAAVTAVVGVAEQHAAFRRVAFQADLQPPAEEKLAFGQLLAQRFEALLVEGRAEGAVAPDPYGLQPALLLGLLHSVLMLALHRPDRVQGVPLVPVLVAQFIDGARP